MVLCILLPCCFAAAQPQTIHMFGRVANDFTDEQVKGVKVSLLAADSTVIVDSLSLWPTQSATVFGVYVPREPRTYIFRATHPDYEDTYVRCVMKKNLGRLKEIAVPTIRMKRVWKKELGEVEVQATRIRLVMRGDTLVYDARAFNLPAGSMLDDLVRQLPGAELKPSGEIFVNGRKIDYLTLNSREFFRGNNRVLLDNLPYYTVKEIKVYEKDTDVNRFLGREAEKKDYVMDVNLKREYQTGYLGHVTGGGGTDGRYTGRFFALGFADRKRFTLFGNFNNINQEWAPSSGGDAGRGSAPRNLTTTQYAGLEFFDEGKSWTERFTATARWTQTESARRTQRQTFLSDGSNVYGQSLLDGSARHMELDARQTFDKTMNIMGKTYFSSQISFNYDKREDLELGDDLTASDEGMRDTTAHSRSESRTDGRVVQLQARLGTSSRLPWGDDMSMNVQFDYHRSRSKDYSKDRVRNAQSPDYRHDYGDVGRDRYQLHGEARYILPTLKGWEVNFSYRPRYERTQSHDRVYRLDGLEGWDASHDAPLTVLPSVADMMRYCTDVQNTHDYTHNRLNHNLMLNIDFSRKLGGGRLWTYLWIPVDIACENADYRQGGNNYHLQRTKFLFNPNWSIEFKWREEQNRVRMSTRMDMSLPDMQLMFPYVNNRDALYVKEGNGSLRPTHTYSWRGIYERKMKKYSQLFSVMLYGRLYRNQVMGGQTYDPATGVYTFRPENVDGNRDASLITNYSLTFGRNRNFTFQDKLSGQYLHSVDISAVEGQAGDRLSRVETYVLGNDVSLGWSLKSLNLKATSGLDWRVAESRDVNAADWNCGLEGSYTLPKLETSLRSTLTVYGRRGYGISQYDREDYVWNLSVSQPLAKGKLVIGVDCHDLLHQLSPTEYAVNAQGRTITTNRSLPHYVMFHLTWHWNKNPKKDK